MPIQTLAHDVAQLNVALKHVMYEMPHNADVLFFVLCEYLNGPFQALHLSCELRVIVFGRCAILLHCQGPLLGFHDGQ